jgi:nitrite reductase/ring-hydroxylating ferredoxin subunit
MRPDPENLSVPPDGRPLEVQPRWRKDFPIDIPRDEHVARRDFAKFMVLVSAAFTAGQGWLLARHLFRRQRPDPLPARAVARVSEVPVGGSLVFSYPGDGHHAILVRLSEDRFVAYDQQCTHLLCPVVAQPEQGRLHCPCHNGNFDLESGRPISGPPDRPLPRVTLETRDGVIYATGLEVRSV